MGDRSSGRSLYEDESEYKRKHRSRQDLSPKRNYDYKKALDEHVSRRYDSDSDSDRENRQKKRNEFKQDSDQKKGRYSESNKNSNDKVMSEKEAKELEEKLKPNFKVSGKLAQDTNKINGSLLKYNEPPEARMTDDKWRIYVFKGEDEIADIPIDHPSCSSQHAVLQYRQIVDKTEGKTVTSTR
ncbi:Smad nuclear-interacting protein 1 [Smittium culicis]|uniref:Smad nuclear-interacting protein 1 n=1 Tax=Smittium culicis TaxID=133412 RepID=A0A1R1XWD3_9FUNG|nr:Smad nuclear-interacting protein 1 [Smittium culicis]